MRVKLFEKSKIFLSITLSVLLLLAAALSAVMFLRTSTASAQSFTKNSLNFSADSVALNNAQVANTAKIKAELIKQLSPEDYYAFDAPTALFSNGTNLLVADFGKTKQFSLKNKSHQNLQIHLNPNAEKLVKINNSILTLTDGVLSWIDLETQTVTDVTGGGWADFSIYNESIFAAKDTSIYTIEANLAQPTLINNPSATIPSIQGAKIEKITAQEGKIYATFADLNNANQNNIVSYMLSDGIYGTPTLCIGSVDRIYELASLPAEDGIIALKKDGLRLYKAKGNRLAEGAFFFAPDLTSFSADGSAIFALSSKKSVAKFDLALQNRTEFLASSYSGIGFYDSPLGITSRKGNVFVADELNNRVQIISNDETRVINHVSRPKAVAVDYAGNLYVASAINEIAVFNAMLAPVRKIVAPSDEIFITDLKIDGNNSLYALSDEGQLYRIDANGNSFVNACLNETVIAYAVSPQKDSIYLLNSLGELKTLNADGTAVACAFASATPDFSTVSDFFLDNDGSLFLLTNSGSIEKYALDGSEKFVLTIQSPTDYEDGYGVSAGARRMIMNTAQQTKFAPSLSYGDVIIADTRNHAVKVIDGKSLGVNEHFSTGKPPDIGDEPNESQPSARIIYTLKENCDVYAQKAELQPIATLGEGMRVIVTEFNANATFTYVIADNVGGGSEAECIAGYVYTSLINAPALAYTAEHAEYCYTWMQSVPIYKYPSRNAPPVKNFAELRQNTKLKVLDFVYSTDRNGKISYGLTDNYPASTIVWYRVSFGENNEYEGYVVSDQMSYHAAPAQQVQYPRTNAIIVAKTAGESLGASVYERTEDGSYILLNEPPIAVGTKVEIVGSYDSSEPYTKIKYLVSVGTETRAIERYGTETRAIERYVETINLEYTGINIVQIVAILVIIVTLILVALVVWRLLYAKRNRKMREEKKNYHEK